MSKRLPIHCLGSVQDGATARYRVAGMATRLSDEDLDVVDRAEAILRKHFLRDGMVLGKDTASRWLRMRYATSPLEVFGLIMLDTRHAILGVSEIFRGTIDAAEVHVREVIREIFRFNAAAVVVFHNHPSGNPEISASDERITREIESALDMINVRLLDHLIVGETTTSFLEKGKL